MAIDWNSYDLSSNETVNYLQPSSSSISLNRILSGNASQIHGQINANGQVVLVNPNGIFFGQNASINAGGLIASGLDIDPVDFMNGDYIFREVIGSNGTVINNGLINASLGGNVTLLGRQVKSEGVINAKLGAITLASGKEAILTFDNNGLIGVRISKEILQNEIGVDPAVLNSGEINASGGRVLLTASVSRDVFSGAVNHGDLQQATSVVVHEDGSFTLGGGADVVNSGSINVSSTVSNDAGQVVILGENVTHTGTIYADSESGLAGMVELHAIDKTELKGNAIISAQVTLSGSGGQIKLLGDKVGLFDIAEVNASGIHGGGGVLVGGDQQGLNSYVRNAEFLYLAEGSNIYVDAIGNGNGGKIITYANDTGRFHGGLYARGGTQGGDGGFIETSGKRGFEIPVAPDVSAAAGQGGLWLIDPYSITIQSTGTPTTYSKDTITNPPNTVYTSTGLLATIDVGTIESALISGDVEIVTGGTIGDNIGNGDIIFDADLDYDGNVTNTLTLDALGGIVSTSTSSIDDVDGSGSTLNINLYANGTIILDGSITTQGGNLTVGGPGGNTPSSFTNNGTIDSTGREDTAGGNISIETSDFITTSVLVANGGTASGNSSGTNAGSITLSAINAVIVNGNLLANGTNGFDTNQGGANERYPGGTGGHINISSSASSISIIGDISNVGGDADGDNGENVNGGNAGNITLSSQLGTGTITLTGNLTTLGGTEFGGGIAGTKGNIKIDGNLTVNNAFTIDANSFNSGAINAVGSTGLNGHDINIRSENDISTGNITTTGGAANLDTAGNNGGDITLNSSGNITVNGVINSSGSGANTTGAGGNAGAIDLQAVAGQIDVSDISAIGGSGILPASNGANANITLNAATTNFNGISTLSTVTGATIDITSSAGTASQGLTLGATGDVNVSASINTNGSDFNVTGVNYAAVTNSNIDTGTGNSSINMTGTAELGAMQVGGTLGVTAVSDITQSAGLSVGGTASFQVNAGQSIVLDDTNNNFAGSLSFAANTAGNLQDVSVANNGALDLGDITVNRNLLVDANGSITDTGVLSVGSVMGVNANGNSVVLDSMTNDFNDLVIVDASSATIVDANGLNIGTADATSGLENADSNVTGNLNITTQVGDLTDENDTGLIVVGVATLNVGTSSVILDSNSNNFATVNIVDAQLVTLVDTNSIDIRSGNIAGDLNLTTGSSITIDHVGNSLLGDLTFEASSGNLANIGVTNTLATNVSALNVNNNLTITSGGTITQIGAFNVTNVTTLSAAGQDINLDQINNLNKITIVGASNALINNGSNNLSLDKLVVDNNLTLTAGAISDGNGASNNIQADLLKMTAANGIGNGNGNELEIQINKLDAENTSSGEVGLSQTGDIALINLSNNGDIIFNSDGDINFNPGSSVAALGTGDLLMQTSSGSFLGLSTADINNPDITAENATFIGLSGTFGTFQRPITLKVPGTVVVQVRGVFDPIFIPPGPLQYDPQGIEFSAFGTTSAVASEQLVEIESLSEVDPAIFTALRNYSYEEISIRMPRDQLYEDELDDLALN